MKKLYGKLKKRAKSLGYKVKTNKRYCFDRIVLGKIDPNIGERTIYLRFPAFTKSIKDHEFIEKDIVITLAHEVAHAILCRDLVTFTDDNCNKKIILEEELLVWKIAEDLLRSLGFRCWVTFRKIKYTCLATYARSVVG